MVFNFGFILNGLVAQTHFYQTIFFSCRFSLSTRKMVARWITFNECSDSVSLSSSSVCLSFFRFILIVHLHFGFWTMLNSSFVRLVCGGNNIYVAIIRTHQYPLSIIAIMEQCKNGSLRKKIFIEIDVMIRRRFGHGAQFLRDEEWSTKNCWKDLTVMICRLWVHCNIIFIRLKFDWLKTIGHLLNMQYVNIRTRILIFIKYITA